jgi:hypothetical protein
VSAMIASKSIDSKKREILTRTRRRYIFRNATQYARGKDGIVRKRRFFVFRECNPRQHLEARLDTFFQKKEKKN